MSFSVQTEKEINNNNDDDDNNSGNCCTISKHGETTNKRINNYPFRISKQCNSKCFLDKFYSFPLPHPHDLSSCSTIQLKSIDQMSDHLIILTGRKIPTPVLCSYFHFHHRSRRLVNSRKPTKCARFLVTYESLRFRKHSATSAGKYVDDARKCGKVFARIEMKALHLLGGEHNFVIGQVFRKSSRHHVRMFKTNTFVTDVLNRNYYSVF